MWVQSLGQEDPLEEGMTTQSNILARTIPWTKKLSGYSPQSCKESDMTEATYQAGRHIYDSVYKFMHVCMYT